MKRATYYVATLMLCGGIITPTAAMAQSFPQPAPASQAAQNPHQVPKPFEVGILKWSQDVYNAGHTSEQEAQRCSSATPMLPTQLGQTTRCLRETPTPYPRIPNPWEWCPSQREYTKNRHHRQCRLGRFDPNQFVGSPSGHAGMRADSGMSA